MFYDKNNEELTAERFKNPDSTYRGAPFWAWNTDLKKDELIRQIGELKRWVSAVSSCIRDRV